MINTLTLYLQLIKKAKLQILILQHQILLAVLEKHNGATDIEYNIRIRHSCLIKGLEQKVAIKDQKFTVQPLIKILNICPM